MHVYSIDKDIRRKVIAVSYTHLDVYKRQIHEQSKKSQNDLFL